MLSLIVTIAAEYGLPSDFVVAIALTENDTLNPSAVNRNRNGSRDLGLMQLNSTWYKGNWNDPETNVRAGCNLIVSLRRQGLNWWEVAIAYNCGYSRLKSKEGPPESSIDYAISVFDKWNDRMSMVSNVNY
jgi:soluble lytic murein transglycosylase-like protein